VAHSRQGQLRAQQELVRSPGVVDDQQGNEESAGQISCQHPAARRVEGRADCRYETITQPYKKGCKLSNVLPGYKSILTMYTVCLSLSEYVGVPEVF